MASRGLLVPPSYIPYIINTAAVISIVPVIAGTVGLLNPDGGLKALYFTPPSSSSNVKLTRGLVRMYSVRQISLGLCTLALWWTGSRKALGLTMLAGGLVATTDGLVAKEVAGQHVAGHWVGLALSVFFSSTLLGVL